ncbi:hypothetical protein Daus18300_003425 [Diaporthe australafricana]|uniref:Piwi domain-containing protein n=1 Tax=Diaporthe australafricana TaxID=127596 RepID=A0ABR3XG15_9PEZI
MSSHRESQGGSVGSGRGGEGSQKAFGGSQRGQGEPRDGASQSQGATQAPPIEAIQGVFYKHPQQQSPTPDKVEGFEDEYQQALTPNSPSSTVDGFPSRPGFGKRGQIVSIAANYFELLVDPSRVLIQYSVDVQPKAVGGKLARIIELFLQRPELRARSGSVCTDFKSTLMSRFLLDNALSAFNITYQSEFETVPGTNAKVYHVRLKHTKTLPVRDFLEFLTSTNLSTAFDDKNDMIRAFNIFLNHYTKSQENLVTFGNKTFPKNAVGRDLGGGLLAIQGFFSSVRAATGRLLVNVNVCYSAFYRPGPLVDLIRACRLQDVYRLEQFLKGARVKTTHTRIPTIRTIVALASLSDGQGSSQRRPKVLMFGAGPKQVHFWVPPQGRYVSVSEFFLKSHKIELGNEKFPVVNVGSKANPIYLPPEVCVVLAGSRAGLKLDADQTSKMIEVSTQRPAPARNALSIARDGFPMVGLSKQTNPLLDQFHVRVNPNFITTRARLLTKPRVMYGNKSAMKLNLLYVILPVKHTALYNRVKHICDVKLGVRNICSVGNKLVESNGRPQYFGNVGLKFNLKGGVDNQMVEPSHLHFFSQGTTMAVGIDVTHPDPNSSNRAPSIVAMVASTNKKMGQFPATTSVQARRQEKADNLTPMLKWHLSLWKTEGKNAQFPENILIFRDGVSEGQYQMVRDEELPQIRRACEQVYDSAGQKRPRITIVVVTKRHHTRFMPTSADKADSNGNRPAGTVTDRGITETRQWDFWLLAHSAIQGQARPAHYFVVHDEIFRGAPLSQGYTCADTLEDVTQSLHYIFGRCTRSVSYCTPAYYADLACDRARRYLSSLFDPSAHSDSASLISDLDDLDDLDDGQRRARLQELITPHPKVQNTMYYI